MIKYPKDERLKGDPDCLIELPYNRILNRPAKAGLEGVITAAIRIYAATHFIKSFASFTTFKPDFKKNYNSIFTQYIAETMEADFKDAQSDFTEFFNPFKDTEFWYAFLEQAVQLYSRKVDDGQILDVPGHVLQALFKLNDMQDIYNYPDWEDLWNAVAIGEERITSIFNLKGYRQEKNLEGIRATEEHAKLVLNELVKHQLEFVSEKFIENLKDLDIEPFFNDIEYYLLTNMSQGANLSNLDGEVKEVVSLKHSHRRNGVYRRRRVCGGSRYRRWLICRRRRLCRLLSYQGR